MIKKNNRFVFEDGSFAFFWFFIVRLVGSIFAIFIGRFWVISIYEFLNFSTVLNGKLTDERFFHEF